MSARRLSILAALALLAGCSKTSARPGLRFNGPSAVAVFHGVTARDPLAVRAYLAVANERGDDLRILDAIDGKAVLAPTLIQSLSVPTAPRPAALAAGGLNDLAGQGADLLAVAPSGLATCDPAAPTRLVSCVQIVRTWTEATVVDRDPAAPLSIVIDDLPGGLDAPVLSMVVVPVPVSDGAGGLEAGRGQARLVASLAGGHLLLADFARDPAPGATGIVRTGAAVHDLGFEITSLSASPSEVQLLYAASPELPGVAELDLSLPVGAAPAFRVIPAGGPTTHVLAARVRPFKDLGADSTKDDTFDTEVTRIYAALDPASCGRDRPITCGLAVLDPLAGGPLPDPAGELAQYLPIPVPGTVTAMVAVYPPAVGGLNLDGTVAPDRVPGVLQVQAMASGTRHVSTLAAVALEDGAIALVDLARGALALDRPVLANGSGAFPTTVMSAQSTSAVGEQRRLGLWNLKTALPGADKEVIVDGPTMVKEAGVTPGYTPTEIWKVAWEGELPGLTLLRGQLEPSPDGVQLGWVAIQSGSGATPATPPYRGVGRLYDPRLGIQVGDLVVFQPDDATACPRGAFELKVTAILPPGTDHPGGAVQVEPRLDEQQPFSLEGGVKVFANPRCLNGKGRSDGRVTFRSGGLLLTGASFGYAGRPPVAADPGGPSAGVAWTAADAALACPMLDDATWPPAACEGTCRSDCEKALLARKARRAFYVKERCPATDTPCKDRHGAEAVKDPTGPLVSFTLGWIDPSPPPASPVTLRGTLLTLSTASGLTPVVRRPASGSLTTAALLPTGLATFDRALAATNAALGTRVLASYTGNVVLDFSPAQAAGSATVHR